MNPRRTSRLTSRAGVTALLVLAVAAWRISSGLPGFDPLFRVLHTQTVQEYGTWLTLVGLLVAGLLVLWRDGGGDGDGVDGDGVDETDRARHRDLSRPRRR